MATRILQEARRKFLTHGFRGVSMDDLAKELGMSKKTLYAHFAGKTALLEAMLADKFAEVNRELTAVTEEKGTPFHTRLHGMLEIIRRHTEEVRPPFLRDVAREAPGLFELVREHRRGLIARHFRAVLREGVADGRIRSDLPEELLIETLTGAADAVVNPAKLTELGMTPRTAFTGILSMFLEGALTEKGRNNL